MTDYFASSSLVVLLVLTFLLSIWSHIRQTRHDEAALRVLHRVDCYIRILVDHWGDDPAEVRAMLKNACAQFAERRHGDRRRQG
jgi:hypothetical protein